MIRSTLVFVAAFVSLVTAAAAQSGPVPRFFGPVNQDGCGFCCEFRCQTTPTPTPEFDGAGRRIFRRHDGLFLLVVEAGAGTSLRQPGSEGVFNGRSVDPITNASGRPSLQVLSDRNLGNGTLKVDCRTLPLGGVKSFAGRQNFPADADLTTGLIDMACRFELATTSTTACTRNRFGDFAFLSVGTTRQYCFQVSDVAKFPVGDTILALQMLDSIGNLGPRQEIVIRVGASGGPAPTPTSSLTRSPSPTPTPTVASIAGRVRYYSADRPVPGALGQLTMSVLRNTTTAGDGAYAFTALPPGNAVIQSRKTGDFGVPSAITALDASWVLQNVAGQRNFDAAQRLAADVTGDGTVSALDATRILQRQVGMLARFAVADRCNSDWIFRPVPGPALNQRLIQPAISTGSCALGAIALEPLVGTAVQQDFQAVLFGDTTGNWQPPSTGGALRGIAAGPHTLRVRSARPAGGGMLRLPLAIKGSEPYYSLDVTIHYDADRLTPSSVRKLRAAGDALAVFNLTRPGVVRIAVASANPMPFGVSVVALDFLGTAPSDAVDVTRAMVDDLPATVSD